MTNPVADQGDTRQRILATAERLFAENGFAGTSLRALTAEAGVNLAAVNYHFRSKERLIEEVLKRRLDWLNSRRSEALDKLEAPDAQPNCEAILEAFIRPAVELSHDTNRGGAAFVRLLARAYLENSEALRRFISDHYGHVMRRVAKLLSDALPDLPAEDLYWRFDFIIGAMTYTMADFGGVKKVEAINDAEQQEAVLQRLVQFSVAGLQCQPLSSPPARTPLTDHFNRIQRGSA